MIIAILDWREIQGDAMRTKEMEFLKDKIHTFRDSPLENHKVEITSYVIVNIGLSYERILINFNSKASIEGFPCFKC